MKNILKCTKKYLPFILLAPITLVIEVLLEVRIPTIMAEIVDVGIPSGDVNVVISLGKMMVLMSIASLAAGVAGTFFSSIGGIGFGSQLRKAVFEKIQNFAFEDIDKFQQSSLLTRLTTDVEYVQQGLRMIMTMFIRAPFMMIAAATVAYSINKSLFVIFVVAIPVLLGIVAVLGVIAMPLFRLMLTKYDSLNDRTKEYLTNIRVVKAYVREDHEESKFFINNKELMEASIKIEGLFVVLMPIISLVVYSCIIALFWLGGKQIMIGQMETGSLIAFVGYVGQILMGLLMMAMIYLNIVRLKGSVDRLSEVLNCDQSIVDGEYTGEVVEGSIEFRNVSFKYLGASKPSVKDVSLKINPGETVGIIGSTGSGKTSLVQLIARLYDASEGEVLVGNRNVKDYQIKNLRDSVAMVLQQNVLFSGTIMENLRWGNEKATDQEVYEACNYACASEFIESFPDGYNTDLGQGGVNVSGGQKQRLCIARALLKKPKIIILDDSTSAVDTHTDMMIRTALKQQLKGTTTIIIAQRISSVMEADKVAVIDGGKVVAYDTPSNLLETNDIYRDIYETQMKGVE